MKFFRILKVVFAANAIVLIAMVVLYTIVSIAWDMERAEALWQMWLPYVLLWPASLYVSMRYLR
jgi:hypothetical protein